MATLRRTAPVALVRKQRNTDGGRLSTRRRPPINREEAHIGATEDQVSVTMPPKADDDEPKQG
jgi:hypothetical protein